MRVCTIIARNYLPYARVLAESLRRVHADGQVSVLVLDGERAGGVNGEQPFEILLPGELPLPRVDFHQMAGMYDVTELATAIKPWLLRYLLGRERAPVVYLDPDIEVFDRLDFVVDLARAHGIVVTPHTLHPMPRDGRKPKENDILISGAFNLGFLAVGESALPFLDWWAERLRYDCVSAIEQGLFVDQRWMDLAVHYFDNHVVRDPGCNVAYWNVDQRALRWTGSGYEVNGEPLRFYHYSGFQPDRPDVLSRHHVVDPRNVPRKGTALGRLCSDYVEQLLAAGYRECRGIPYGYSHAVGGFELTPRLRRLFRDEAIARATAARPLPDLFDPAQAGAVTAWMSWAAAQPHPTELHRIVEEARRRFSLARWRARLASVRSLWGYR